MDSEADPLTDLAQPICPNCGVTTNPEEDADVCQECGWRVEHPEVRPPGFADGITELDDWR